MQPFACDYAQFCGAIFPFARNGMINVMKTECVAVYGISHGFPGMSIVNEMTAPTVASRRRSPAHTHQRTNPNEMKETSSIIRTHNFLRLMTAPATHDSVARQAFRRQATITMDLKRPGGHTPDTRSPIHASHTFGGNASALDVLSVFVDCESAAVTRQQHVFRVFDFMAAIIIIIYIVITVIITIIIIIIFILKIIRL